MSESSDANPDRILWGIGTSRTIRAHWALHELGLDYQMRPIQPRTGETLSEEYSALTARQKVPLLQDRGLVITESAAIIAYLSDTYGQQHNRLMPIAPTQRAKYLEWCFFIISELDATSLYVMRRHLDLKAVYGEAPAANAAAAAYFQKQMRTVDRALADGRSHLMEDGFGGADILLSTCISWATRYEVPVSDQVLAYNAGIMSRKAYAQAAQSNAVPPTKTTG